MIELNSRKIESCLRFIDEQYLLFDSTKTKVGCLEDYFDISIGRTPPTKEHEWFGIDGKGNIPWLSIKDMQENKPLIFETSQWLTPNAVMKFKIPVVEPGDVLLSFKLTVGRTAIACQKMVTNEAIADFKADDNSRYWLFSFLRHSNFLSDGGNTSSIGKAVNSSIIRQFPCDFPSNDDLSHFNTIVSPIFLKMENSFRQNIVLNKQKKLLLHRYFESK